MEIALLIVVLMIVLIIAFADVTGSGTVVAGAGNAGRYVISLIEFVRSYPAFLSDMYGAPIF